jgi:pyruvate,orthophosphate dikinase
LNIKSKALEVNIADYHVDVAIDEKYFLLKEVMSQYYGIMEGLNTFLQELSHPYRNWQFIVKEARAYSLNYFHLLKGHPKGPDAAVLFVGILSDAIEFTKDPEVRSDAVDNLLLFLNKILTDAGSDFPRFLTVINDAFDRIRKYPDDHFFLFVKSYCQIPRLSGHLIKKIQDRPSELGPVRDLLERYYHTVYDYWLGEVDPGGWFEAELEEPRHGEYWQDLFDDISHRQIAKWQLQLNGIVTTGAPASREVLAQMLELPAYNRFVDIYRRLPQHLLEAGRDGKWGNGWKVIFLFHIMGVNGLSMIHEETLRDINRTLAWLIGHEKHWNIRKLIKKTFSILKDRAINFPATALDCVLNMGRGVYETDEIDLVNFFINHVIDMGFQTPMINGIGNDWQIRANTSHILNIRMILELIEQHPQWSTRLLSSLIIHLSLCGIFIRDTDLFPRDITRLLNSHIKPVYNLVKQLARVFPVYFNDIGAEGHLRDISTRIDEIYRRKDVLVHFLRKQSHVESSNRIIDLMEAMIGFWKTRDKRGLGSYVPPQIYSQIQTRGPYIDDVYRILQYLENHGVALPSDLLAWPDTKLSPLINQAPDVCPEDKERVQLGVELYKLLHQKYNLNFIEMDRYLARLGASGFSGLKNLRKALKETDLQKKLFMLLDYLENLKEVILSSKTYEIKEDIYKKRHITIDIPSMYGSYHETKFDALGLTFRIESLVNVLFEELLNKVDLRLITRTTFYEVFDLLVLFDKALKIDGMRSVESERQLDLLAHSLEVRGFSFTQYVDIFKGFVQAVRNIINDNFNNVHEGNLDRILAGLPTDRLLEKYTSDRDKDDPEKLHHRVSEIFFRDRIALSLGLQQLDVFLTRLLNTLFYQSHKLPPDRLRMLLNYDPQLAITNLEKPNSKVTGIIFLGNKGLNMMRMKNFGLPVPPGFIITTEVFRCREMLDNYPEANRNFKKQVVRNIAILEKATGKIFGDPKNPLLFSVRSGSSISQPGMMDTLLNVGMNEDIAAGIEALTGNGWFAWDNYRRFLQCYGMSFGLERDDFDSIISEMKRRAGIPLKRHFTGPQMRKVALTYKGLIKDYGIDIVEDPLEQLLLTIKVVFDSWQSAKAVAYRRIMGISDDWGTAATVQDMVYGNVSRQSGSGVIFTHNPHWPGDSLRLWGDFTIGNQGEDVVSGLVRTLPISIAQQDIEMRDTDTTLESHFPEIYAALKEWAHELIGRRGWSPQEMEFTFEGAAREDLFLLQTRDMAMRERKKVLTFDPEKLGGKNIVGHGIGVSGGAMSGRVVFDLDEIYRWREQEPNTLLILLRSDTVPDDIREINAADGLLTARGGLTSHAAVVAHRLGKTCVVGCSNLICNEKEKYCTFDEAHLKSGEFISIDGLEGIVCKGFLEVLEA